MPENRRVGEVREGHLKIFEIISTQSAVLGMKIVLKSYPQYTIRPIWTVWGAGRRGRVDEWLAC